MADGEGTGLPHCRLSPTAQGYARCAIAFNQIAQAFAMHTTESHNTAEHKAQRSALDARYTGVLRAVCQALQTVKPDLEPLLAPLRTLQPSTAQATALLKRSWARLEKLRASRTELDEWLAQEPLAEADIVHHLEQAFHCLQGDANFSLEGAAAAFEQAGKQCLDSGCAATLSAAMCAAQAQLAAVQLDDQRAAHLYAQAARTPGLRAPLQWHYYLQQALVLEERGQDRMDDAALEQAIELYQTRVLAQAPRTQRPHDWATTQHHLGQALGALGQRQRGTWHLQQAIAALQAALSVRSRDHTPLDWAATQNSLGNTLGVLAQRCADTEKLEQAVAALHCALEVRSREDTPLDWAVTQNNLAAALLALGQRKQDKTLLKQATDAYKQVLTVWTRARVPQDWATTMHNLGTALRLLGEHRKGPRTLEQAVAAYKSALSERTHSAAPQAWAMTQNNLGAALQKLGEREQDSKSLTAAIEAYDNALQEWTHERSPMTWAMTLANRCAARKKLAELTIDIELLHQVLRDFDSVASVFRNASHAQYYELVTEQIALTRKLEQALLQKSSSQTES